MLKPLSGLLNLALPTALREKETGPDADGRLFADVFAALDHDTSDSAEAEEGEEASETKAEEPEARTPDDQGQTTDGVDVDPVVRDSALAEGRDEAASPRDLHHDPGRGEAHAPFKTENRAVSTGASRDRPTEMRGPRESSRAKPRASPADPTRPPVSNGPALPEQPPLKRSGNDPIVPVKASPVERAGASFLRAISEGEKTRSQTRRGAVPPTGTDPASSESQRPRRRDRFGAEPQIRPEPREMSGSISSQALSTSTQADARQPAMLPGVVERRGVSMPATSVQGTSRVKAERFVPSEDALRGASGSPPLSQPDKRYSWTASPVPIASSDTEPKPRAEAGNGRPSRHGQPDWVAPAPMTERGSVETSRPRAPKHGYVMPTGEAASHPRTEQRSALGLPTGRPEPQSPGAKGGWASASKPIHADGAVADADRLATQGTRLASHIPRDTETTAPDEVRNERSALRVPGRATPPVRIPPEVSVADVRLVQTGRPAGWGASEASPAMVLQGKEGVRAEPEKNGMNPVAPVAVRPSVEFDPGDDARVAAEVKVGKAGDTDKAAIRAVHPPQGECGTPNRVGLASSLPGHHGAASEPIAGPSVLHQPGRAQGMPVPQAPTSSPAREPNAAPVSAPNETFLKPALAEERRVEPRKFGPINETRRRGQDHGQGLVEALASRVVRGGGGVPGALLTPPVTDALCERPAISVISPVIDLEEPLSEDLTTAPLPGGGSAQGPVSPTGHGASLVPREGAGSVLRQAAEAMSAAVDAQEQVIELKLRPEELGQLRFRIGQGETGLILSVSADRPETLDLLRRNIDQLARHLSDLGYESASFSFGEERPGSRSGPPGEAGVSESDAGGRAVTEAAVPVPDSPVSEGLDLRL